MLLRDMDTLENWLLHMVDGSTSVRFNDMIYHGYTHPNALLIYPTGDGGARAVERARNRVRAEHDL
jgi:hypothetical protein